MQLFIFISVYLSVPICLFFSAWTICLNKTDLNSVIGVISLSDESGLTACCCCIDVTEIDRKTELLEKNCLNLH